MRRARSERSEVRAAENEATFREANEHIQAKRLELDLGNGQTPYICECEEERCTSIVRLTPPEYEQVRAHPRHFVVVPGHEESDDLVVSEQERFTVVEKTGEEGRLVDELDPRRWR